ncbi:MAG: hypothetical protein KDE31_07310 [Caldilineaceae bacterium]|nr:hypothetical protein [Caldilineaceae bacterium]
MWILGFPYRAQELAQRMLTFAPELGPSNRANIPFFAAILYRNLKQERQLSIQIEQLVTAGNQFSMWLSIQSGKVFRGWELAHQGKLKEGIALTQQGVDNFRQAGHTVFQTHRLAMLAEMQLMAHHFKATQTTLDEALSISQEKGERFWDVEIYRLQGNLLLAQGAPATQAEQSYLHAITIAQQQGAKSLELRATTALCRLLQPQGRSDEAYQALSQIYGWFTEGFDTYDLRVAQALLTELSV